MAPIRDPVLNVVGISKSFGENTVLSEGDVKCAMSVYKD